MRLKITALFIIALLLTACSSDKANTPPVAPLVKFTPTLQISQIWEVHPGDGRNGKFVNLTIATANQILYSASYDGRVFATNAQTGDTLWSVSIDNKKIASGPAVANNLVVVTTTDGYAVALDAKTGKQIWQANIGNEAIATPKIAKDLVLIKTIDGKLLALNASNGKQLWSYSSQAPALILRGGSQAQVANKLVIAGFANGKLTVLDLNSGKVVWSKTIQRPEGSTPLQRMTDIIANPLIAHNIVYAVTYQGRLAALNLQDGQLL